MSLEFGLEFVIEAVDRIFHGIAPKQAAVPLFKMIVGGFAAQVGQVGGKGPHVGINGHAVVIEEHDQRFSGGPGVVKPLVGKAAGESAVSDEGQNTVILMCKASGPGHPQRHGHRIGGMSGNEGVMLTLPGLGEPGETAELPQG